MKSESKMMKPLIIAGPCSVGSLKQIIAVAHAIMKGYEIYYNFVRKYQDINCCPYELAIPDLELDKNK